MSSPTNGEAREPVDEFLRSDDGAGTRSSRAESWPDPPTELAYHGLAGRIAKAIDPHTEADPVAVLVQMITAFGNAMGRGPHFLVESTRHYPCLNVVLVGQTAKGRKGTSWDHVRTLFLEADEDWTRKRVTPGLSSGEGLIWAVRDPIYKKEPVKEKNKIVGYQDALVDEGVSDKRLLAMQPEFVHVLKVATREGNTLSATIRQAWDSGDLRVLTKNSPAVATDVHMAMIGHITGDELLRHMEHTEAANGFANRFLWICVRRSKLLPEGGGFHSVDVAGFVRQLRDALTFSRQHGNSSMARDSEARDLWHQSYRKLSADRAGMAGAVLGRAEAQVMRLALLYALLDCSSVVRAVHLRAALALWDYVDRSVRYIFGDSTGDKVADGALGALRESPKGMTRTELFHHFGRHLSADQMGRSLAMLVRVGLARMQLEATGGRPAERWFAIKAEDEAAGTVVSIPNGAPSHFASFAGGQSR